MDRLEAPSKGESDRKREQEQQNQVLVLERDAGCDADEQPLSLVPPAEEARDEIDDDEPREHVERRRREKVPNCHDGCRSGRRGARDQLSGASRSDLPADEPDEHDDERSGDGRDDAQPTRISSEGPLGQPPEQRCQRRLVVVPERRVSRCDAEVELVAVVAVAIADRHEERELCGGDGEHERPGDRRAHSLHAATR